MVISSAVTAQPGQGVQPSRCVPHCFPVGEALQEFLSVLLHSLVAPQDSLRSINSLGSFGGPLCILLFLIDRDRSPELLTLYGAKAKKSTSPIGLLDDVLPLRSNLPLCVHPGRISFLGLLVTTPCVWSRLCPV